MEHGVNVNMRIGVHTGYILSGIIGLKKWQYDIWSKDVTIANQMESTGKAGYVFDTELIFCLKSHLFILIRAVHITQQTKDCLVGDNPYDCQPLAPIDDPVLRRNNISTFLIVPEKPIRVRYFIRYKNHN